RRDYQTALEVAKADGSRPGTVVSNRYYLADADFLVGLAGENLDLLEQIDAALAEPHWPLSLGRKAFVPGLPVCLPGGGLRPNTDLRTALYREPWPEQAMRLRVVLEAPPAESTARRIDQPGPGAAFLHRRFLPRPVVIRFWTAGADLANPERRECGDV
ncbi:MAG: hypothetical protein KC442_12655, partial [Thermomicrobiales bacterium]|nr:hypothetical protein [Thermomicrobiales bacterium]